MLSRCRNVKKLSQCPALQPHKLYIIFSEAPRHSSRERGEEEKTEPHQLSGLASSLETSLLSLDQPLVSRLQPLNQPSVSRPASIL